MHLHNIGIQYNEIALQSEEFYNKIQRTLSYNFLKFSRIFTLCYIHNTQLFWLSFVFLQCFHVCWVQMWWDNKLEACKLLQILCYLNFRSQSFKIRYCVVW
jgi:hypothetical protein